MDWLHQKAQTARQNLARQSQMRKCWFCLASWAKNLQETWRKLLLINFTLLTKAVWLNLANSFKFPANFWSRKLNRTSNFSVWLSGPWYPGHQRGRKRRVWAREGSPQLKISLKWIVLQWPYLQHTMIGSFNAIDDIFPFFHPKHNGVVCVLFSQ